MRFNLQHLQTMFSAAILGISAHDMSYQVNGFQNYDFKIKIRESSDAAYGRLIAIMVRERCVDNGGFLFEAWFVEPCQVPGVQTMFAPAFPTDVMCFNRSFGPSDLKRLGSFMLYEAVDCIDFEHSSGENIWQYPPRPRPGNSMFHPNGIQAMGFGGQMGMSQPPVNPYSPGGPYYQQPGYPSEHHHPQFGQQYTSNRTSSPRYVDTVKALKDVQRHNFIDTVDTVRNAWLDKHYSATMHVIQEFIHNTLKNPNELQLTAQGELANVKQIDAAIETSAVKLLQNHYNRRYKDTGIQLDLAVTDKETLSIMVKVA